MAAAALSAAYLLYSKVNHMLRLTSEDDAAALGEQGLQRLLARAAGVPDFAALSTALEAAEADVAARFSRLVGDPA